MLTSCCAGNNRNRKSPKTPSKGEVLGKINYHQAILFLYHLMVVYLAEEVGFEPTERCRSPVFKTGAFDRAMLLFHILAISFLYRRQRLTTDFILTHFRFLVNHFLPVFKPAFAFKPNQAYYRFHRHIGVKRETYKKRRKFKNVRKYKS